MTVITLVRHGQASFNGPTYDRLSDLGVRQARLLGDYFVRVGRAFDAIYAGAMARQTATAEMVRERLAARAAPPPLRIAPEFNEYDSAAVIRTQMAAIAADDRNFSANSVSAAAGDRRAFRRVLEAALLRWISGKHASPEVETWREFVARVHAGLARVASENTPGAKIALFVSGGPLVVTMQQALALSDESAIGLIWHIRNASCSVFGDDDGRLRLFSFNSTPHLELENDPALLTYL